ncbi:GNAT family N-acetyltransferase [Actinoplanes oblitus]|uniref:GNAT family N-acetyltransferase n=1 Tax=Actinoplanes oblitus TaxID=3040509 RepID=A0ABY8W5U6_9ACTN|nr:GNAT family N-acetyltransferase [Actinoplanes oblitus]WIM92887.1 GNAT family N-acetyltransferase [Actinoplanes oblitus]
MSTRTGTGWTTETVRDDAAFRDLRDDWDELYRHCATASAFQSHGWLTGWWQGYARPGRLRLTVVRRHGRLVAAAPLMLDRRGAFGVLVPLGGALADHTEVLVADDVAGPAARALAAALLAEPGWQAVDLPESRPGAVTGTAFWDAWPGRRYRLASSVCQDLPALPLTGFLAQLPGKQRRTARHGLVTLNRSGLVPHEVTADEADRAVADLLRLHELQWRGRGIDPEHVSPAFAAYLCRAVTAMLATGQAALVEYRAGDRLMASHLMFVSHDSLDGYLSGVDPALRKGLDVTMTLLADALPRAHRLGLARVGFLRGEEPYKDRWRPRRVRNQRIVLVRPASVAGLGYAARVRAGRAVVAAAKRHAPWLRTLRDRLRR